VNPVFFILAVVFFASGDVSIGIVFLILAMMMAD